MSVLVAGTNVKCAKVVDEMTMLSSEAKKFKLIGFLAYSN